MKVGILKDSSWQKTIVRHSWKRTVVKTVPQDLLELLCPCWLPFFFHSIFVGLSKMTDCHNKNEQIPSGFNKMLYTLAEST